MLNWSSQVVAITDCVFCNVIGSENSPWKAINVNEVRGLVERHQTLSSRVESGPETNLTQAHLTSKLAEYSYYLCCSTVIMSEQENISRL